MKHKDILELKKRLKKEQCTISAMSGCYVNSEKQIVATYRETFLNMEESEFFKYLEIARKILSGTLGNNLLELGFQREGEADKQAFLIELKKSRLKDDGLLEQFYQSVIGSMAYTGNYLILLFSDAYDVMSRTSDNQKLDESEETYEYVLCAICPVGLSEPGLHYQEEEQRMRANSRRWMVEAPAVGFVYPAFSERSSDVNSVLYYAKNPREPHPEVMAECLGCEEKKTAALQKDSFQALIREAAGPEEEKGVTLLLEVQENLKYLVEEHQAQGDEDEAPLILTTAQIQDLFEETSAAPEALSRFEEAYSSYFEEQFPQADSILDPKLLKAAEQRKKEENLVKQVKTLKQELEQAWRSRSEEDSSRQAEELEYDVQLQVRPEKVPQIKTQFIDGQKCLIVPLDENEQAAVNGQTGLL